MIFCDYIARRGGNAIPACQPDSEPVVNFYEDFFRELYGDNEKQIQN